VLFNSYLFIFAFLPLALAGFFALRHQGQRLLFIVLASYIFYAWAAWWFPALMLATTAISFVAGRVIAQTSGDRTRKVTLAVGIAGVLGLLGYFKYAGFTAYYASKFLVTLTGSGIPSVQAFVQSIVLPVGISFFTFEAISYMVDVYRGTIPVERNPLRYAFFISFFPHLIAGPIVRYGKLGPQLRERYRFDVELFRSGLFLFTLGLAKKVLLADGIAQHIDKPLAHTSGLGAVGAWSVMVGYAFQIYFDFSGYSDMALGLARMFGIELPWNFNRPYRAASPQEFWRRWHVTLSSWLRDYLYIPLGGNRKGEVRRDLNIMVTMGLGGLWHGASLNFLIWGLYQGGLLVGNHHAQKLGLRIWRPISVAITFVLVTCGWVFFRFRFSGDSKNVFEAMAGRSGLGSPIHGLLPFLVVSAVLMWCVPEEWSWDLRGWGAVRVATLGAVAAVTLVAMNETSTFLYFRF